MSDKGPISANKRRKKGLSGAISRFFGVLAGINSGKLKKPGKSRTKSSNAEYHLAPEEIQKIIGACGNIRDKTMIRTFAETGIRRFELANLRIEYIDSENRVMFIHNGKGNKSRVIPMTAGLLSGIKALSGTKNSGYVFLSRYGNKLSLRQVNRIVAIAGTRAGVKNPNPKYNHITCHLFRHSFARYWKNKNGSIESLSRLLGHSSTRLTWDVYGRESMEDIKRNYQKVMLGRYKKERFG